MYSYERGSHKAKWCGWFYDMVKLILLCAAKYLMYEYMYVCMYSTAGQTAQKPKGDPWEKNIIFYKKSYKCNETWLKSSEILHWLK